MTNSVAGQRRCSKALPKVKLPPEEGHGHWWSAASLTHYSSLNPEKIITFAEKYAQQINEMHWKWQHLQQVLVNRMDPILLYDNAWLHIAQPMLQKSNELSYDVLHHLPYSSDFSRLPLLQAPQQLFVRKTTSTTSRRWKMHSKSFLNPETCIFMLQEKINLFLFGKNVLMVMVPIVSNTDVFEPSYTNLKFMVQNCNYFYTNLVVLDQSNPKYSLGGLMLKLKLQYFGHLMQRADSLKKTLMLGKTEGRRRRGQQMIR